MDSIHSGGRGLQPLPYHLQTVQYLKSHEPEVWAWASSQKARAEHVEAVRASLLRNTYRVEPNAHPEVHATMLQAMQRLGIDAPATLYQAGGHEMNASLVFVPGEIHVVMMGQMLERLSPDERLALFGHELAHYLLWSRDGGDFHVADRILNDALASPQASPSHRETLRRYSLHTELFADRGGAIAADALAPTVSTLVKVQTGVASPDAAAYLRQAAEIDTQANEPRNATTHPETFVRARALELWWQNADRLEEWIEAKLHGPLSLEALDLAGQVRLQAITRGFMTHFLADTSLRSDLVVSQVRELFSEWSPDEPASVLADLRAELMDDSVRGYLNALMLDLALVDADVQDAALLRAATIAHEMGSLDALQANLKRDARFGKRELDRLKKKLGMMQVDA
ncbi:M48 family metalloprotease [Luteimonas sp. WGS1318]|uniref:M48 family metalloprotease n=1 Tax=Luteimonas sp. WGS1318 TaxID=3366815 RepID=UPI00372D1851